MDFYESGYGRSVSIQVRFEEKHRSKDQRRSNCTDCKKGIFTDHVSEWTSRGLIHSDCDDPRKENEATDPT